MQGVEEAFRTLHSAFTDAFSFFLKGVLPNAVLLTEQQAIDVLDVYDVLLSGCEEGDMAIRRRVVELSLESGFHRLLADVLAAPLSHTHAIDAQSAQPFLSLRLKSSVSLLRLFIASSDAGEPYGAQCYLSVMRDAVPQQLLRVLAESPHASLRLSVGELLFVFVLRVPDGPHGFAAAGGVRVACRSLAGDGSARLRRVCACLLRRVVASAPDACAGPPAAAALCAALRDNAPDVRALAAEVLAHALRQRAAAMAFVLREPRALMAAMRQTFFAREENAEAVAAAAMLVERAHGAASELQISAFFAAAAAEEMERAVLRRVAEGGPPGAACARALRAMLQYTPPSCALPMRLLQETEGLAIMLKGIVDAGRGRAAPGEDAAAFRVKSAELAIALAVMLAQAPAYRAHLAAELAAHPQWAAALKNAAVSLLNDLSLDAFAEIELWDVAGCHMNAMRGVAWANDRTPERAYVQQLFRSQLVRTAEAEAQSHVAVHDVPVLPEADAYSEEDRARKLRLTHAILVFSILTTFPVDSSLAMETGAAQPSASPAPQRAAGTPRFSPDSRPPGRGSRNGTAKAEEQAAMAVVYDKFDSSMALVMHYAQHYAPKRAKEDVLETDDGYLVHSSKLKNPWKNIVENQRLKTWELHDLKVGDLFYFSIPFDDIGEKSLDAVIHKTRRHMVYIKKELLTTPHVVKGRRWFLHDMMRNIMPKALEHLESMKSRIEGHGGDSVRFPIFLFREKELHFGERALHTGNLVEVIDQIKFYFSQNAAKTIGIDNSRLQELASQITYIKQEAYMEDASTSILPGTATTSATARLLANNGDYDEGNVYGHGTISSDSEPDE